VIEERGINMFRGADFLTSAVTEQTPFTLEQATPDQRALALQARSFLHEELTPRTEQIERGEPGLMRKLLRQASERSLLSAIIPAQYGGLGAGLKTHALLSLQLGPAHSFFVTWVVQTGLGALPIIHFGSDALKATYLPGMATGEVIGAFAVTEAEAGSDIMATTTQATCTPDRRHYLINGAKKWISNAGLADVLLVLAKVDGKQFTFFAIDAQSPGVSTMPEEQKMGLRGTFHRPLSFENSKVPTENMVWNAGMGIQIAQSALVVGRLSLALGCASASQGILAHAIHHVRTRRSFGKTLSSFGLTQQKLADLVADIYAAESVALRGVGLVDEYLSNLEQQGKTDNADRHTALVACTIEASIAKVLGSEVCNRVADESLQLFGGLGYIAGHPAEMAYRNLRPARIYEGTNEINRLVIASMLLRRDLPPLFPYLPALEADLAQGHFSTPLAPAALIDAVAGLERVKRAAFYVLLKVVTRRIKTLEHEQQILGYIADVVLYLYAIDSSLARALSIGDSTQIPLHALAAKYVMWRYLAPVRLAIEALLYCALNGDELNTARSQVYNFVGTYPADVIQQQRDLSALALERGGYPYALFLEASMR
jgi:alkylation response protein AidB-like acyl-CoA dehydrogenase